ncbi:MAG: sortase [Thermomicrobiales bacterium]|nr:sortase [Thermomicrobiales bacterium]
MKIIRRSRSAAPLMHILVLGAIFLAITANLTPVAGGDVRAESTADALTEAVSETLTEGEPEIAATTGLDIQATGGPAYVTVHTYLCDDSGDWAGQSYTTLRDSCASVQGVAFTLTNTAPDGAVTLDETAVSDVDGLAFWAIDAPGVATIAELMPPGYGDPMVFCGLATGMNLSQTGSAGGIVSLALAFDEQYYCDWFNVMGTGAADEGEGEGEEGSVTIFKLICLPESGQQTLLTNAQSGTSNLGPRQGDPNDPSGDMLCTEFETEIGSGFTFDATIDGQPLDSKTTDDTGYAGWTGMPEGEMVISEQIPDGYGTPYFYCHAGRAPIVNGFTNSATLPIIGKTRIECVVVNVPETEGGYADVVIYKWVCETYPDPVVVKIPSELESEGCFLVEGVDFDITYGEPDEMVTGTTDGTGTVEWGGIAAGDIAIEERVPAGYGEPVIYCESELPKGSGQSPEHDPVYGAALVGTLSDGEVLVCHWINVPSDDVSITIYKYTCPAGYDLWAYGADPVYECAELTDGVEFTIRGDAVDEISVTGSAGAGAVAWNDLAPGGYAIEETPPVGNASAFVLSCDGGTAPMIQNVPLSTGYDLWIEAMPGDHIVCYWYNVPEPDWGSVTVIKYACATEHFVNPHDCQIYEDGVQFQLFRWTGSQGSVAGSGVTNSAGVVTFSGLEAGWYELDEIGAEWCYAEASRSTGEGYLDVLAGKKTTVWVYNCGVDIPKKPVVTYPNTGVGPGSAMVMPSAAPVSGQGAHLALPHNRIAGILDSRIALSLAGGSRPVAISIDSIGLSAEIEVLEIVDGAFQEPTTSDKVAWYKETGRPGVTGNMILAGHLNYWGDPEGVFFALDQVQEGDLVQIVDPLGGSHQYEVTSVELLDATSDTLQAIAAESDASTLTLITCGGQWDGGSQTYLQRTVVKAELVG